MKTAFISRLDFKLLFQANSGSVYSSHENVLLTWRLERIFNERCLMFSLNFVFILFKIKNVIVCDTVEKLCGATLNIILFCRAAACLFSATEHCHDSIEIATLDTDRGECLLQVCNTVSQQNVLTGPFPLI